MNKARAMLDALMGPGRDVVEKDKGKSKDKFKDPSVCKSFLVGLCPMDAGLLGGKRSFAVCDKIHSDVMKQQFEASAEHEDLASEYKLHCLKNLEYAVRECDSRILQEKARIRDDWGNRRPPLPVHVIDQVSRMKRESSSALAMAEALDDDKLKEKEQLLARSNEIMKDAEALEDVETKKAIKAAITEEVCEVCGTCYQGSAGYAAHLKFKVHGAYEKIRAKLEELRPLKEELEKKKKDEASKKRAEDFKRKDSRKEGGDAGSGDERDGRSRDRDRRRDDSRPRSKDRAKDRRKKDDSRDRGRRSTSRQGRRDRGDKRKREDSRSRNRGGGGGGGGKSRRDDSRSRRRR